MGCRVYPCCGSLEDLLVRWGGLVQGDPSKDAAIAAAEAPYYCRMKGLGEQQVESLHCARMKGLGEQQVESLHCARVEKWPLMNPSAYPFCIF